ncbi:MAG TPA: hypothetical protein VIK37_01405 [Candidatus Saccharimonadales bacterium]
MANEFPSKELVGLVVEKFSDSEPYYRLGTVPPVYAYYGVGDAAYDTIVETAQGKQITLGELAQNVQKLRKAAALAIENYDLIMKMRIETGNKLNLRDVDRPA